VGKEFLEITNEYIGMTQHLNTTPSDKLFNILCHCTYTFLLLDIIKNNISKHNFKTFISVVGQS
jgi:hypothetical protein